MALTQTLNDTYTLNKNKLVESNCVAITFLVKSTSNDALINGILVAAGDQLKVDQSFGYIDSTWYDVVFQSGAGSNELIVSRILIK